MKLLLMIMVVPAALMIGCRSLADVSKGSENRGDMSVRKRAKDLRPRAFTRDYVRAKALADHIDKVRRKVRDVTKCLVHNLAVFAVSSAHQVGFVDLALAPSLSGGYVNRPKSRRNKYSHILHIDGPSRCTQSLPAYNVEGNRHRGAASVCTLLLGSARPVGRLTTTVG